MNTIEGDENPTDQVSRKGSGVAGVRRRGEMAATLMTSNNLATLNGGTDNADAALLRTVLDADWVRCGEPWSKSMLLLVAGLPGTGKTHFVRRLLQELPFLVLETDRLRKELVPSPTYTPSEHRRLFDSCHLLIYEYLAQEYPVLFDATNLTEGSRTPLYQIAKSLGRQFAVVEVTAPREVVRRRLQSREAGLDPDTNSDAGWLIYCRMAKIWEPIVQQHYLIDSSSDTTVVLEQVVKWASSAGVGRSSQFKLGDSTE